MALAILTKSPREGVERNTYNLPQGEGIRRSLRWWFREQRDAIFSFLRTGKVEKKDDADGGIPNVPDFDEFGLGDDPMAQAMTPLLEAIFASAGQAFMGRVGLDPDEWTVTSPNIQEAIEQAALELCQATNETTKLQIDESIAQLRQVLANGLIDRGETIDWLTKRIGDIFSDAETWRARRIATTEASRAVHAAQEMAAIQYGGVTGWKWLLSEDACPLCQMVASECPAVRIGQAFAVVGNNPTYSTVRFPPLHPSCQCTIVEVLETDEQPEWGSTLIQPKPDAELEEVA